jgi:hypothetical protein
MSSRQSNTVLRVTRGSLATGWTGLSYSWILFEVQAYMLQLTLSLLMSHICGVSKTFGEWYQNTIKTEDTNKLTLLAFKIIAILQNTRLATFIKLLKTVSKGLFRNRSQNVFWTSYFFLHDSPAPEIYKPTFRNTVRSVSIGGVSRKLFTPPVKLKSVPKRRVI